MTIEVGRRRTMILLVLACFGRMSKRMIAKDIGQTRAQVGLDLQWLRGKGLIETERHGRSSKWIVTDQGREAARKQMCDED